MGLIYTVFVPHPPLLVPEVGRGEEHKCQASLDAYQKVARRIAQAEVETVILISLMPPSPKMELLL